MPLYAYRCTKCGHKFEKIQHFDSEPELVCHKCGGVLERPLTAPAFNFKGSGWYVNDYAHTTTPSTAPNDVPDNPSSTPAAAPAPAAAAAPAASGSSAKSGSSDAKS